MRPQKCHFSNSLLNWEQFEVISFFPLNWKRLSSHSEIRKSQNLFVNWETVEIQPKTTLKNSNFESIDELGKARSQFKFHC